MTSMTLHAERSRGQTNLYFRPLVESNSAVANEGIINYIVTAVIVIGISQGQMLVENSKITTNGENTKSLH